MYTLARQQKLRALLLGQWEYGYLKIARTQQRVKSRLKTLPEGCFLPGFPAKHAGVGS